MFHHDNLVGKQGGCFMKAPIKIHTYISIKTRHNSILTIHNKIYLRRVHHGVLILSLIYIRNIHMPSFPCRPYSCILHERELGQEYFFKDSKPNSVHSAPSRDFVRSLGHSVCLTVFISPDVIILAANFRLLRRLPADLNRFCVDFLKEDESLKSESQSVRNGLRTE